MQMETYIKQMLSNKLINKIKFKPKIKAEEGISKFIDWYKNQFNQESNKNENSCRSFNQHSGNFSELKRLSSLAFINGADKNTNFKLRGSGAINLENF